MILVSLRTNGRCVETMEFNGSINGGIYLVMFNDILINIAHAQSLCATI